MFLIDEVKHQEDGGRLCKMVLLKSLRLFLMDEKVRSIWQKKVPLTNHPRTV